MNTTILGNAFTADERCVCAGYDNGDIKMFDLRTMTIKWSDNLKNGVSRSTNTFNNINIHIHNK